VERAEIARRELEECLQAQQAASSAAQSEREKLVRLAKLTVQEEADNLLAEVRRARSEIESARKRLKTTDNAKALRGIEREVSAVASQVALGGRFESKRQNANERAATALNLEVGTRVRLRNGSVGTVLEEPSRGRVLLRVGALKVTTREGELELVLGGQPTARRLPRAAPRPVPTEVFVDDRALRTGDNTLDLRGARVDEAKDRLEVFVDRLIGEGEGTGFVLHGHGTGALKVAVREHLETMGWVRDLRAAHPDEGGDAFTVFWVR
jgi:DNA mismatch repair protein MutS2